MYGLGIRLGIYMQWLSSILLNAILKDPSKERGPMNAALVYNVTLLVVIFLLLGPETYAIEFLPIFLFIINGYLTAFGFTFSPTQIRDTREKSMFMCMRIQAILNQVIMPMALLYYSWFWIWGFNHSFAETPCGSSMFLMAHLEDSGVLAARVVYGIISVFFGIYTGLILFVYLVFFPDLLLESVLVSLVGSSIAARHLRQNPLAKLLTIYKTLMRAPRSVTFGFTGLVYNPDDEAERHEPFHKTVRIGMTEQLLNAENGVSIPASQTDGARTVEEIELGQSTIVPTSEPQQEPNSRDLNTSGNFMYELEGFAPLALSVQCTVM
ncbi:hypothetical protein X797_012143 [Metarhizium robertsii]|nr:hypothetical protein X797_012143 [Metarhizium robertsii]